VRWTPHELGVYNVDVQYGHSLVVGSPFACKVFDLNKVVILHDQHHDALDDSDDVVFYGTYVVLRFMPGFKLSDGFLIRSVISLFRCILISYLYLLRFNYLILKLLVILCTKSTSMMVVVVVIISIIIIVVNYFKKTVSEKQLYKLYISKTNLSRFKTARLVAALVLSCLDYCNAMLAGLPASTLAPFQRVLHAAARTVLDLKPRVTPALRELHWLPVAERIQCKLCLLVHKSLLGHMPEYISDVMTLVANIPGRYTLRASSYGNLVVPRTCRRIGDKAFSVAAPRAWNRLPTELKLLQSTDSFRRDPNKFLFHSVYGHQGTG